MMKISYLRKIMQVLPLTMTLTTMTTMTACSSSDDNNNSQEEKYVGKTIDVLATAILNDSLATRGYWTDPGSVDTDFGGYTWNSNSIMETILPGNVETWNSIITPSADGKSAEISYTKKLVLRTNNNYPLYYFSSPENNMVSITQNSSGLYLRELFPVELDTKFAIGQYINTFTQNGINNMDHLAAYDFIYAKTTLTTDDDGNISYEPHLSFTYMPVILRFAIDNLTDRPIIVRNVEMVFDKYKTRSGQSPFCADIKNEFSSERLTSSREDVLFFRKWNGCHPIYDTTAVVGTKVSLKYYNVTNAGESLRLYGVTAPFEASDDASNDDIYTFHVEYTDVSSDKTCIISAALTGAAMKAAWNPNDQYYKLMSGNCYTFKLHIRNGDMQVSTLKPSFPFNNGWGENGQETDMNEK